MQTATISFIGAGNMASSLIGGLVANGYDPQKIWASNPHLDKLNSLKKSFNICVTQSNYYAAEHADILIFSVEPHVLKTVATELSPVVKERNPLVISIAVAPTEPVLRQWLGGNFAIVRAMPNTPSMVRNGATGLFANAKTTAQQKELAESILRAVGVTLWVDNEDLMNVVAALSGSGPAYFFLVMEAMQAAGEKLGLTKDVSSLLTRQTALGTAHMAIESKQDVSALRAQVTSPRGTTEQAIKVFEQGHIRELFFDALKAAQNRARELAALLNQDKA